MLCMINENSWLHLLTPLLNTMYYHFVLASFLWCFSCQCFNVIHTTSHTFCLLKSIRCLHHHFRSKWWINYNHFLINSWFNVTGLIFIRNPFTKIGSEYWIRKSFSSYCLPPNPTNVKLEIGEIDSDSFILQKLRWATLGYHHNWDTKVRPEI